VPHEDTVNKGICLLLAFLYSSGVNAQQYVVSTVAGGGAPTLTTVASQAQVGLVTGIAADAAGNVYFSAENCVFRIDSAGVLTRVAGNGRPGYSGDGGAANAAQMNAPGGLAIDARGNLLIADAGNEVVRSVIPDGVIRTVPGSAISPVQTGQGSHVAVAASGDIFISNRQANGVWRLSHSGSISRFAGNGQIGYSGDGGPAALAAVGNPTGIAVDGSGNVFIVQSAAVRKVSPAGIITTVAGTGTVGETGDGGLATQARLNNALAIAVDSAGALYIAEPTRIRKVASTGIITTIAGGALSGTGGDGGPAIDAQLTRALGIAVTPGGDLYIADNVRIRHVTANGVIETIAGAGVSDTGDGGPAPLAQLSNPSGIALDAGGNLYIADNGSRIRKVSPAGIITTLAGGPTQGYSGDGGPAVDAQMQVYPLTGMAADLAGDLFVVEQVHNDVREITAQGLIRTFAGPVTSPLMSFPNGLAMDGNGNLFVADTTNGLIRQIDTAGNITTFAKTNNGLNNRSPYAVAVDGANNVYVSYSDASGITEFSPNGSSAELATDVVPQQPMTVDAAGNVYVFDSPTLVKIAPEGTRTTVAAMGTSFPAEGTPAMAGTLIAPTALAVDSGGDVFVADSGASAVFKLHAAAGSLPPGIGSVYDRAADSPALVSPGETVILYGVGMGPATPVTAAGGGAETTLGGAQVRFDGRLAALVSVSGTQITAVVPYGISASTKVTVTYGGQTSAAITLPVAWTDSERQPKSGSHPINRHLGSPDAQ